MVVKNKGDPAVIKLPIRDKATATYTELVVPKRRHVLFLTVDKSLFHDKSSDCYREDLRFCFILNLEEEEVEGFLDIPIHSHVPVPREAISRVISGLGSARRKTKLSKLFRSGACGCTSSGGTHGLCRYECLASYCCFYNESEKHPFLVSTANDSEPFTRMFPQLAKLERLARETRSRYHSSQGHKLFDKISTMVYTTLTGGQFRGPDTVDSMYGELDKFAPGGRLNPLKVYDQAFIRYMFSETLKVGRLFQASTTFNYVIANTATRYTVERIMLFNCTGPGEGKTYANQVLACQFKKVPGCIESLTSFTQQAFKYHKNRTSCIITIDTHIAHEKSVKMGDRGLRDPKHFQEPPRHQRSRERRRHQGRLQQDHGHYQVFLRPQLRLHLDHQHSRVHERSLA
ncbi:hypothetical protein SKAU_G00426430 [Synaphobranchus kaupii]|uniref:Uncharacterized protein n=1 Tax=Synaphobranchus kaupii TaxID=118154 RepID=A0A9Q1E5J3_SYNKA|nr:hypothetical protein SKAU_G00426430 [Synaphobranchus kaupii]